MARLCTVVLCSVWFVEQLLFVFCWVSSAIRCLYQQVASLLSECRLRRAQSWHVDARSLVVLGTNLVVTRHQVFLPELVLKEALLKKTFLLANSRPGGQSVALTRPPNLVSNFLAPGFGADFQLLVFSANMEICNVGNLEFALSQKVLE